jgi:hypothetical protein
MQSTQKSDYRYYIERDKGANIMRQIALYMGKIIYISK